MGDCGSRPDKSLEEAHLKEINPKNNEEFKHMPSLHRVKGYADKSISTADDQDEANKILHSLEKQIPLLEKELERALSESPKEACKLTIEIQKGKDIIPNAICVSNPKPYVRVELFPVKLTFLSSPSCAHIPSWYEINTHKVGIENIKKIIVKVYFKTDFISDIYFGSTEIDFSLLSNEEVFENWFAIECEEKIDAKPAIRLRLQAIFNEKEFNRKIIKKYEEIIPAAKEMKTRIQARLKKCQDDLNLEGDGY